MDFPQPGQRITIRGLSGSGKTTLGDQLEEILAIPHTEMDALFWKENWGKPTDEEFFPKIEAITSKPKWILCGNYTRSRHLIDPYSDTLIWLDYPFSLVMSRLLRRTIFRGRKHQLLWGHCRESVWSGFAGKDAIIWYTIRYRKRLKQTLEPQFTNQQPGKIYLRFRSPSETEAWLKTISKSNPQGKI